MGVACAWVGERRCAALPGEWRGEYSNSIIAPSSVGGVDDGMAVQAVLW